MAADFSRVRLNPLLDYAGVELQQGRVLLDGDVNELVAIVDRRLRALAADTLGRATVASTTPGAFKITPVADTLQIGSGRLYVDGLLAENHGAPSDDDAKRLFDDLLAEGAFADPIAYATQPYLPEPPALPGTGRHLVYLDVWNREVTSLETPALVESALGIETSSRLQTVWQVRVLTDDAGSSTSCASPDADLAGWSALIAPSTGRLTTGTFEVAPTDDPCELPPTGGYRGLENQLYRVEIHDPGLPDAGATFKWSRENASVGSRVASLVSATELELDTLGRDDVLRFNTGDWVEIVDDAREFSQRPGEMRKITVTEATRRIAFTPALPAAMLPPAAPSPQFPSSSWPAARNLRVRRWDHKGGVFRTDASASPVQVQDLDAVGSAGVIAVPAGTTTLILENGITVHFDAAAGTRGFKTGDCWVFAARTSDASVELLDRAPPRGIHHHHARLAIWDVAAGSASDCRKPWPPVAGGSDCGCTVCVTPEAHASGQLTIQAAVDRVRDSGGTVCLHAGQYALDGPVRVRGINSLRIHGQGPATLIVTPGGAFSVEQCTAIAIEDLAVISLGRQSALSASSVLGLALRELVVAVFATNDARGAGIALAGIVGGATIRDNLVVAPDGIRALDVPANESAAKFLITAGLTIENNLLWCQNNGVLMSGLVAHKGDTAIRANQLLGCRNAGLSMLGGAYAGASVRLDDNNLNVNGPGIACGTDGAWIGGNKIAGVAQGERQPVGSAISLLTGLDTTGSDQCQVLANQVSGFPDAALLIAAPAANLVVKLNIIERCGNGIVMTDAAAGGALSIENNHLSDIGTPVSTGDFGQEVVGIGLARSSSVTIAGNTLRRIGIQPGARVRGVVAIDAASSATSRVQGNDVVGFGPVADTAFPVIGVLVLPPYLQTELLHNHVERDEQPTAATSNTACWSLLVGQPSTTGAGSAPGTVGTTGVAGAVSRLARFTTLAVDDTRTLVISGRHAFVDAAPAAFATNAAVVNRLGASASVLGNVLIARGSAPAAEVTANAEVLFNDNRCELRGGPSKVSVLLNTPVAIVNANRVRGPDLSILVGNGNARVAAIGNITSGRIQAPLPAEMLALNLIAP